MHTPTPWSIYASTENAWIGNVETGEIVADRPSISVAGLQARWDANAAFITRACNNHESLLAALEAMCEEWRRHGCCDSRGVEYRAEQALARAKGDMEHHGQ